MGETKIEWVSQYLPDGTIIPGYTFNPVIGCTKVSQGCKHCYAEQLMANRWHKAQWGPQARRIRTSSANWGKPLQWDASAKADGRRARVFCASLADVFEDHKDWVQPRRDLLELISETPHLDWLLLTKRPENVEPMVLDITAGYLNVEDFANIWLGTSVEDQATADKRIPELLKIPANVRFLSCEPMLEQLDLDCYLGDLPEDEDGAPYPGNGIQWVIAGGESGAKARPMEAEWVRSLRDQCQAAGTAFFLKQLGGYPNKRGSLDDIPEDLRIREFPEVYHAQ